MAYLLPVHETTSDPSGTPLDTSAIVLNLTNGKLWAVVGGVWTQINAPTTALAFTAITGNFTAAQISQILAVSQAAPKVVTANYTTLAGDPTLDCNASVDITVTLSAATQKITIKNSSTTNKVTVAGTIDGVTNYVLPVAVFGVCPSISLEYSSARSTPSWILT